MKRVPLLSDRSWGARIALAVAAPALLGAVTGYLLGVSKGAYLLVSLLAAVGGIAAGFEHPGARDGATRGLLGGTLFGAFVLIAHQIHDAHARVQLPKPAILLVVITAVAGALLGALGGYLRGRRAHERPGA